MKNIKTINLGNLITISKGKKYKEVPFENSRFRYINIEDLHGGKQHRYTNDEGVLVTKDEVLIAWDGANAGKVGVGFDGVIGSTLARLTLKNDQVVPKFLFWFLESKIDFIKSQRTGATIPHINGNSLKEIPTPLPPLATQKRIAEILDKADALRQKDQALLRKYDELAQAVFVDMFGQNNVEYSTWPELTIEQIAQKSKNSMRTGPFGSDLLHSEFVDKGVLVLGIDNVVKNKFDFLKFNGS